MVDSVSGKGRREERGRGRIEGEWMRYSQY